MTAEPAISGGAFDPPGVVFAPVSSSLITVRLVSLAIWFAVPLAGTIVLGVIFGGWVWVAPAVVALLVLWLLWLIPRQVRAMGYSELDDDLLVRKGILFRSLTVVPYGRMQFVDVTAGPLDRACGVAQVRLHTAAAQTDATIPGLPPEEASRLRDRLTARGEARLAGL
ncbi:PH domain-containing protein [Georgenia alba]|uniref:PH domain-containing protein n=1 Tax=Georgenia alba TaxID=2233858 RepID=A0ABW2QC61_9MICO